MVALIGVLLAWKFLRKPEPPPAPPPVAKPLVVQRPLEEPPPPPPMEPEPPPPPAPVLEPVKATKRNTGCDGACNGKESPELISAMRARGGQSRSCYERALISNGSLHGKMLVNVRIGPAGDVCSASLASDTLGDPSVTSCVLQRIRSGRFPKPTGGCVDTALPLNFVPRTP